MGNYTEDFISIDSKMLTHCANDHVRYKHPDLIFLPDDECSKALPFAQCVFPYFQIYPIGIWQAVLDSCDEGQELSGIKSMGEGANWMVRSSIISFLTDVFIVDGRIIAVRIRIEVFAE